MKQYFYIDSNNQQVGPIGDDVLKSLVYSGKLSPQTYIWTEGFSEWQLLSQVFSTPCSRELTPSLPLVLHSAVHCAEPSGKNNSSFCFSLKKKHMLIRGGYVILSLFAFLALSACDQSSDNVKPQKVKKVKKEISRQHAEKELHKKHIVPARYDKELLEASINGRSDIAELLLAAGANVNTFGENGYTALHESIEHNHVRVMALLLEHPDIDVNAYFPPADCKMTPLHYAVEAGLTDCVELLLQKEGIKVDSVTSNGCTPLYYAVSRSRLEEIKLLIKAKANVNLPDEDGRTPLDIAVMEGQIDIVELLLDAPGIDVNAVYNKWGVTSLMQAAGIGYSDIVSLLLEVPGIDINRITVAGDNRGFPSELTALLVAAKKGHAEVVRILVNDPRIDINKSGIDGMEITPLHMAVGAGHIEIVKLLLAQPAIQVNAPMRGGDTPLQIAKKLGHTEIAQLLKAAGAQE